MIRDKIRAEADRWRLLASLPRQVPIRIWASVGLSLAAYRLARLGNTCNDVAQLLELAAHHVLEDKESRR